jgi:hypothetical protein
MDTIKVKQINHLNQIGTLEKQVPHRGKNDLQRDHLIDVLPQTTLESL